MKRPSLKKIKKHAQRAVVASVASASILVGGIFTSPSDLMNADGSTPTAVIEMTAADEAIAEDNGGDAEAVIDERRKGLRARMRLWIMQLPPWLRAMVGVPLWGLGWLLISTVSALWAGVLSPVAGGILKFLCIAGLCTAVLCAVLKAAFPNLPLKEILNKRCVSTLLIGLGLVGIAGWALGVFYPEGQELAELVRWLGALAVLTVSAVPAIIKAETLRHASLKTEV